MNHKELMDRFVIKHARQCGPVSVEMLIDLEAFAREVHNAALELAASKLPAHPHLAAGIRDLKEPL